MKKNLFAVPLLWLLSCGQGHDKTTPIDTAATKPPTDTVVWVGTFSRWTKSPGEEYDGNYDAANNIFIICGNHKSVVVPADQVKPQTNGTCDTSFSDRVRVLERTVSTGKVNILGSPLRLTDSTIHNGEAEINTGTENKIVPLRHSEVVRLNEALRRKNTTH
jgi:hypothetical protein